MPLFFEEGSAEFWNVIFSLFPLYLQLRKAASFFLKFLESFRLFEDTREFIMRYSVILQNVKFKDWYRIFMIFMIYELCFSIIQILRPQSELVQLCIHTLSSHPYPIHSPNFTHEQFL